MASASRPLTKEAKLQCAQDLLDVLGQIFFSSSHSDTIPRRTCCWVPSYIHIGEPKHTSHYAMRLELSPPLRASKLFGSLMRFFPTSSVVKCGNVVTSTRQMTRFTPKDQCRDAGDVIAIQPQLG